MRQVPTLPAAVEEVVCIALAKDPHQRFKSVTAFAQALKQASRAEESSPLASGAISSPSADLPSDAAPPLIPMAKQAESLSSPSPSLATPSPLSDAPAELQEVQGNSSHGEEEPAGSSPPMSAETKAGAGGSEKNSHRSAGRQEQAGVGPAGRIERGQLVAMALGILLYGGVNFAIDSWYKVSSPLATTSLSDQRRNSREVLCRTDKMQAWFTTSPGTPASYSSAQSVTISLLTNLSV